tara:strand:- start:545 stop:823 length:279 start_codon:yes stop_codon:yes gene_type:complete
MKKNIALLAMMALAISSGAEPINITKKSRESRRHKLTGHVPFKEEEGVLKMIEDYNLIKQGKSKKGAIKQNRIKSKINEWLKSGMLNKNDLK